MNIDEAWIELQKLVTLRDFATESLQVRGVLEQLVRDATALDLPGKPISEVDRGWAEYATHLNLHRYLKVKCEDGWMRPLPDPQHAAVDQPEALSWINDSPGSGHPPLTPCPVCLIDKLLAAWLHTEAVVAKFAQDSDVWQTAFAAGVLAGRKAMREEAIEIVNVAMSIVEVKQRETAKRRDRAGDIVEPEGVSISPDFHVDTMPMQEAMRQSIDPASSITFDSITLEPTIQEPTPEDFARVHEEFEAIYRGSGRGRFMTVPEGVTIVPPHLDLSLIRARLLEALNSLPLEGDESSSE